MKEDKTTFTHRNLINLFIVYELGTCTRDLSITVTSGDCLFRAVKLNKNADHNKYGYSGYSVGFDVRSQFSLPSGRWGKNAVTCVVDNSLSLHTDNRKKIS